VIILNAFKESVMRNRIALASFAMVALSLAAAVSAQESQDKPPTGDGSNKNQERTQDYRSALERQIKQIEEETKRQMEQLEHQKKKIEAQAKVQLEQLDVEAKKMAQQARMQMQGLMKKFKDGAGEEPAPDKSSAGSGLRPIEEKLDKILDRLDKLEQRLDRLERERRRRTPETPSKPL
jgi:hypothetical protein